MNRRIYLSFPQVERARQAVAELERLGIAREQLHSLARSDVDLSGLPIASDAQRKDRVWFWDRLFWYANLALFAIGLVIAGLTLSIGAYAWTLAAGAMMLLTYLLGAHFATRVPHVHLTELRVPLLHGEVVLMVDVPPGRVAEIEHLVARNHPEVIVGGVGWTLSSAGR